MTTVALRRGRGRELVADEGSQKIDTRYVVTRAQKAALYREATIRAELRGQSKPDSSEVLREVLSAWMAKR